MHEVEDPSTLFHLKKSRSRVREREEGVAWRNRRVKHFSDQGSLIYHPGRSFIFLQTVNIKDLVSGQNLCAFSTNKSFIPLLVYEAIHLFLAMANHLSELDGEIF